MTRAVADGQEVPVVVDEGPAGPTSTVDAPAFDELELTYSS